MSDSIILMLQFTFMQDVDEITSVIIEESIRIHRELGPGLLESVYEEILFYCLDQRGLNVERQKPIPVYFEDVKMEIGFRLDMLVENCVIVEIKSVETMLPVHYKQVTTYLKLTDKKVGLLINFNEELLKRGLKRIVNNY